MQNNNKITSVTKASWGERSEVITGIRLGERRDFVHVYSERITGYS